MFVWKFMNLIVGEFYAIKLQYWKEEKFCYCADKTIHGEYSHSYFMVFENLHTPTSIHDCAQYVWDSGYCNSDRRDSFQHHTLSECRMLTDDEVFELKLKLNRFNKGAE